MTSLYDATREDIAGLLSGQPAFRLKQVWEGLYTQFAEPSQILTLPGAVREELSLGFPNSLNLTTASVSDKGDTIKFLWRLHDGALVESVLMRYTGRITLCISSQAQVARRSADAGSEEATPEPAPADLPHGPRRCGGPEHSVGYLKTGSLPAGGKLRKGYRPRAELQCKPGSAETYPSRLPKCFALICPRICAIDP